MDNSESWKALLRALDSMPHSTSSEISFPFTTTASGTSECIINFTMSPLSNEWKKSHIERSPDIVVFENLSMLPAMDEEEVIFGEKKTFVVGGEDGWRAINTVVELAGIELEKEEETVSWGDEAELGGSVKDVVMERANSNETAGDGCVSEDGSSSASKGEKRRADSQDFDDASARESSSDPSEGGEAIDINLPHESVTEQADNSASKNTSPKAKRPRKKRRTEEQRGDSSGNDLTSLTESPTNPDSSHLVEIAQLCELMGKSTSTHSDHSSEADEQSIDPNTVPKIKLVRRKANKLQCQRCIELGSICDTQTPCSPCKRLNRGPCVCRPCEEDRDAVREFAIGKNEGVAKKLVLEKKALFFDKRGRFCKKEEAVRTIGEEGIVVPLENGEMEG